MAAEYPATIPNLSERFVLKGLAKDDWAAKVEEEQALFDAIGAMPAGPYGTVANAIVELSKIAATFGSFAHRNLRIDWASNTTVTVAADLLAVGGNLVENLNLTLNVTGTGALGSAASRTKNKWYYVWVGVNPTTGLATGELDDAYTRATVDVSHADFDGFTAWLRVGAVRTNATGSGNFIPFTQEGQRVVYGDALTYSAVGPDATVGSGSPMTVSAAPNGSATGLLIPPVARHVDLGCEPILVVVVPSRVMVRPAGTSFTGVPVVAVPLGGTGNSGHFGRARVAVSSAQEVQAWWSTAGGSAGQNTAVFYLLGYDDSFTQ